MLIPLMEIKSHLRLPLEVDVEVDAEIERLHDAAVDYAEQYLGRNIPWSDDESSSEILFPASVKHAILILIAEFYENREQHVIGASVASLPTVERLLHFYRIGLGV